MNVITGLYAITSEELMQDEDLIAKSEAALVGGCKLLQYRNKHSGFDTKITEGNRLRELCDRYGAKLIVNDSIELANIIKADGVHLGQTDESITLARKTLGKNAIIGATCHDSLLLAKNAIQEGASYIAFGRFFPSQTKPNASPASLSLIMEAKNILSVPIVAIGGINRDNAHQLISAGADCIAISNDLFSRHIFSEDNTRKSIGDQTKMYQSLFC